jgi:curved DNA-binding protein CbpA
VQGNLGQSYLPEIIHSLHDSRETGILSLTRDKISKRIYFGEGTMTFANSTFRGDRLGEFLVRSGKMTQSHLALASQKVARTGRRLGETFVSMGLLTETEMEVGVAEQVLSIIYSVFPWDSGEYRFQEHASPIADDLALRLPTIPVLLEGVRQIQDAGTVRRALGDPTSIVSYARDFSVVPTDYTLTSEESFVLSRVDGQSSVADIIALSPLPEEQTLRCLYALLSGGFLELGSKSRHLTPSPNSIEPLREERRHLEPSERNAEPRAHELSPEEQWIRDDVVAKRAAVAAGTYYDWLELRRGASSEELKKAYLTMIKRYHPDRLASRRLAFLRGDLEDLLSKMTEAYQTLASPVARRRFDNSLRTEAPRGEGMSPRRATPERAASSLENIAARYYREAKQHFSQNRFHETVELMEEAVRFDPNKAKYHKLLARALAKNPFWGKRAEEHFEAALQLSPFDFDCLVGLGELYDAAGMTTRARSLFAQALELDPTHAELRERLSRN